MCKDVQECLYKVKMYMHNLPLAISEQHFTLSLAVKCFPDLHLFHIIQATIEMTTVIQSVAKQTSMNR